MIIRVRARFIIVGQVVYLWLSWPVLMHGYRICKLLSLSCACFYAKYVSSAVVTGMLSIY